VSKAVRGGGLSIEGGREKKLVGKSFWECTKSRGGGGISGTKLTQNFTEFGLKMTTRGSSGREGGEKV